MTKSHPHMRGIVYALASYTLWVLVDALLKSATESHIPVYEIMMVVSPVIAVAIFLIERRRHPSTRTTMTALWPKHTGNVSILSLIGFGAFYLCVVALAHLPLNNFYIAVFTAPMTISLMAYVFLKEKLGMGKLVAILVGFGGVVYAEWPTGDNGGDLIGYAAAVGCATFYAASIVLARKLTRSESAMSITFFNALQQTGLSLVLLLLLGHGVALTPVLLLLLLLAGVGNGLGNLYAYLSVTHAPAASNGAYHYTQLVTGACVAYLVWHEIPSLHLMTGAVVIVGSGLYLALHTHKKITQQELLAPKQP